MKTILIVFGTRPEAIKMAPVIKEIEKFPEFFNLKICVTGQHRELLHQVIKLFDLKIDFDLDVMSPNQNLTDISVKILSGMSHVITECQPNLILVHGDTTTSMITALAAFYSQIPVGHIEAGLRTNDKKSPWPEEMNRQITGRIADFHFCPTESNKQNLLLERINPNNIFITGNTVIDALLLVVERLKKNVEALSNVKSELINIGIKQREINDWELDHRKLVLITGHRRESFGEGFLNICNAIKELAYKFPDIDFVYPVHLNPNVRNSIKTVFNLQELDQNKIPNIKFIEPLNYLPFVFLMEKSYLILTDSGGVQEEAPGIGKPVFVMRENTERPEALESGTVKLVGTDKNKIVAFVSEMILNKDIYDSMSMKKNPYGDGTAAKKIVKIITSRLS